MTTPSVKKNLQSAIRKTKPALELLNASVSKVGPIGSISKMDFEQLEPYDALCDRFIRAVESCIKFFKSYSKYSYGYIDDTFRSLCNSMEKQDIISSTDLWFEIRDIRNRIVHEYLPGEVEKIYNIILNEFSAELMAVYKKIVLVENDLSEEGY